MMLRSLAVRLATATCLIAALSAGQAAWASPDSQKLENRFSAEQMHETGLDTLSPAQLARLNELLQQQEAVTVAKAVADTRAVAAPRTGADRGAESFLGLDSKPITTRLKGSVSHWEPGTEFQLANGQTWKVLKGYMTLRKTLDAPEVILVPGIAGRWFLQIDEDAPKARVYRID